MPHDALPSEIFLHVRVVIGIVLGLAVTRCLNGVAHFVQHPGRYKLYPVHLGWVAWVMLMLVHFWWWQFWLRGIEQWTFALYMFLMTYATLLFLLCALLFPDNIAEYSGYEEFFLSRRRWFFGILGTTFVFDLIDTLLKGRQHFESFGVEYFVRTPACLILCVVAMITTNRRFHALFVTGSLFYEVSWILRQFRTLV